MGDFAFFVVETIIKSLLILAIMASLAGLGTYAERKVLAYMQGRIGPWMVGPAGILQIVADMIKLFTKEDIIPKHANRYVFLVAPLICAVSAFVAMAAVPFFPEFELFGRTIKPILSDVNVGILFVLGASATGIYGIMLAGLASYNKWGLIASARSALQLLSYEVVNGLSIIPVIMMVGSLSLVEINLAQSGGVLEWFIFKQPAAFLLFLIASFVECSRTPLCLTENESELVSGYGTEYSGMRWGMFFIGEYANMITLSFVISLIFFGGHNDFWVIPGFVMIILKASFFFFLFLWTRAAWPHLRGDQLMWLCWKVLLPISLLNLVITGFLLI